MPRDAEPRPRREEPQLVSHLWEAIHGPLSRAAGHGCLRLEFETDALARAAIVELEEGLARCLESLEEELELSQLSDGENSGSPDGELAPEAAPFALERTIRLALRAVAPRARARGIVVRAILDPDLPGRFRGVSRRVELLLRAWLREALAGAGRGVATLTARAGARTQRSARVRFELALERRRCRPQRFAALADRPALAARLLRELGGAPVEGNAAEGWKAIELPLAFDGAA